MRLLPWSALALVCMLPVDAVAFEPNVRPRMSVARATGPITIDGRLDDAGWAGAAATDRWQQTYPGYNVEPEVGLDGWLTYDDENLYLAIEVREDPGGLRATHRDRDDIWRDDYVGLILDTYGNGAWAYEFFINPYGVQGDLRWTPDGEDMGFDVVWDSEGRITQTGWRVEVAIPFRSLRFPERAEQSWRGTFWYNRSRESRQRYSWSAADRDDPCWPCTWGTIEGIEGVSSGGALEVLPSLTGFRVSGLESRDDPTSDFDELDSDIDVGVGVRYGLSSSVSLEGTFNPDFSQVESDAAQIDANTTFALFFPERRPFFQEGSDLYGSYVSAIYTRSINDPQWATKATARGDHTSSALLVGRDETSPIIVPSEERSTFLVGGRSTSVIGRGRATRDDGSFAGALGTMRVFDGGGSNAVFGGDGMIRFLGNMQFEGQLLFSRTHEIDDPGLGVRDDGSSAFDRRDGRGVRTFDAGGDVLDEVLNGEDFWGHAAYASIERGSRYWFLDLDYWRTSEGFRADNGFVTQSDNQRGSVINAFTVEVNNGLVDEIRPFFMVARVWNIDGGRKDEWFRPELNVDFKGQTGVELGYLMSNEWFGGSELRGIRRWNVEFSSRFSQYANVAMYYERGDFPARGAEPVRMGDGQAFGVDFFFKSPFDVALLDRVSIEPSFDWQRLEDPADGSRFARGFFEEWVTRTRVNFQATRDFFARVILQYDDGDVDVEPLLTYRFDPFTLIYVGATSRWGDYEEYRDPGDPRRRFGFEEVERQWFVKVQAQLRS